MHKLIIFVSFFVSCGLKLNIHSVKLSDFEMYQIKERHTSVILLESFILDKKCRLDDNVLYANAFLCKTTISNDTILVFSVCDQAHSFLKPNYRAERDLNIDSSFIVKTVPSALMVNVDQSVISKKYKYLIADINKLEY